MRQTAEDLVFYMCAAILFMLLISMLAGCASAPPKWEMYRFTQNGTPVKVHIPSFCEQHPGAMGCK